MRLWPRYFAAVYRIWRSERVPRCWKMREAGSRSQGLELMIPAPTHSLSVIRSIAKLEEITVRKQRLR